MNSAAKDRFDTDVLVIGSGFGGSVAALRLAEKGYSVRVVEAGRRFADDDFAKTSWDVRRYLWAPKLGCYGVQRIHRLRDVMILAGAGAAIIAAVAITVGNQSGDRAPATSTFAPATTNAASP